MRLGVPTVTGGARVTRHLCQCPVIVSRSLRGVPQPEGCHAARHPAVRHRAGVPLLRREHQLQSSIDAPRRLLQGSAAGERRTSVQQQVRVCRVRGHRSLVGHGCFGRAGQASEHVAEAAPRLGV
eukprot:scaffold115103_cov69-Phaeocystis_antarctica.AAC.3